jgi:hypothetical protein
MLCKIVKRAAPIRDTGSFRLESVSLSTASRVHESGDDIRTKETTAPSNRKREADEVEIDETIKIKSKQRVSWELLAKICKRENKSG